MGMIPGEWTLKNGILRYCSVTKYPGVKISDCGILNKDINLFLEDKPANVTIMVTSAGTTFWHLWTLNSMFSTLVSQLLFCTGASPGENHNSRI